MEMVARVARIGDKLLSLLAVLMIFSMLTYGGYSLWDNYMVNHGAFLSKDLLKYKPADDGGENLSLEDLLLINEDACGWITIDDTHIDYPVVQGEDDLKYVNTDVFGEFSLSGAIFLSCKNKTDFSDGYSLLYGHHMDNGGMFGDVVEFTDEEYFSARETGILYLPHKTYQIRLFACMEVDAYDSIVYGHGEGCDMQQLLDYLKTDSTNYRDIGVTVDDKIIGMSTCVDAVTNGRVVLFGRLEE